MIIRSNRTVNYSVIKNTVINDSRLSLKAKGLAVFILSKPDKWSITAQGLESQLIEGRDAILTTLKELENTGYLVRDKMRDKQGRLISSSILYEEPVNNTEHTGNGFTDSGEDHPLVSTDKVNTNTTSKDVVVNPQPSRMDKDDLDQLVKQAVATGSADILTRNLTKAENGNPDVNALVGHFEQTFDLKMKRVKQQRFAAQRLIKRYGLPMAKKGVDAANAVRDHEYAPQILNLEDLWDKWDKLESFYRKKQKAQTNKVAIIKDE